MRIPGFAVAVLLTLRVAEAQSVSLERIAPKRWRATYALSQPITSLRFERPAGFFRERVWTIVTPGYRLSREGDRQMVTLDSGSTASRTIVFEFPEFTEPLPKEYELFQPFTDGSVAIYTGHFYAVPGGQRDSTTIRRLRIEPPKGTHAIVRGKVENGTVRFEDRIGDGTYVYVGKGKPIETEDVVAIVDPGMPVWIAKLFDERLPELFHGYTRRFGAKLPWKPVVLFGFEDNGSDGLSSGGGTLTGLINMTLSGQWKTETPVAREQAIYLIAHEAAHLWNGQLVTNAADSPGAWMHEGAADAAANEVLLALGAIDSSRYRVRQQDALNRCATAVATGSVETAIARGAIQAAYDCGFMIAMWTAGGLRTKDASATMFTFWRELIRDAQKNQGRYDVARYFNTLTALGVTPGVTARMSDFVRTRDSIEIMIAGLRDAGIPVREGRGTPPAQYQDDAARAAMIHLMNQACGRVSLTWSSPVRTNAFANCEPFAKEMLIGQVNGLRLHGQGAAVNEAVRAACASAGKVDLQAEDGTLLASVSCSRPLPARPRWFELTN